MKKRIYKEGVPQHVYYRGKDTGIIFYCQQDCIYFITLYTCLAEGYGITTTAFSLMPNHAHAQQSASQRNTFSAFNQHFASVFARVYNRQHRRTGGLFDRPFGSYPKSTGKLIKSNLSYICNNGAEGKLSKGILDYRWSLMAYYGSRHPFSEKVRKEKSSKKLRDAMRLVTYYRKSRKPLDYCIQDMLFEDLDKKEKAQMVDFILSEYNPIEYEGLKVSFGSFDKAMAGMEANSGSEHDIPEDWDDYSVYNKLNSMVLKRGYDLKVINFENTDKEELMELRKNLKRSTKATEKQLDKYLHMDCSTRNLEHKGL